MGTAHIGTRSRNDMNQRPSYEGCRWLACLLLLWPSLACSSEESEPQEEECTPPSATYDANPSPSDFVATVDNPFFPLTPGASWHYEGGGEVVDVVVLGQTKEIMGVSAIVVQDTVTVDGVLLEDTYDWYAQDTAGNVWYLGEDSTSYEGGTTSKDGSWEWGVDGALPGIVMQASPQVGQTYRQEFYLCEAEDEAEIQALDESVSVAAGDFSGCLKTREYTRLEPDVNENKYYADGVGLVLEVDIASGARVELTSFTP